MKKAAPKDGDGSGDGAKKGAGLLDRSAEVARQTVKGAIRSRYFPELWYVVEHWHALVRPRRVLEVGAGRGLMTEALVRGGWDVTAFDSSDAGVIRLKRKFSEATPPVKCDFVTGDPDNLPFAGESFEAVVSMNMLEFSTNPYAVMREIARVLMPGGRAVVSTFNKLSPWGVPAVARLLRHDVPPRDPKFLPKHEFIRILKASGLEIEDVKDRAQCLPVSGVASKVKLPVAGALVAMLARPPKR
jgi:ubiquinone/menaquinone biosynthesis C-methylase UbiE